MMIEIPQTPREAYEALQGKCFPLLWTPHGRVTVITHSDFAFPDVLDQPLPAMTCYFCREGFGKSMGQAWGRN